MRFRSRINYFIEAQKGKTDWERLAKFYPEIKNYENLANVVQSELNPYYKRYIEDISPSHMAISLELSTFLVVMSNITIPSRIIDLGSGFSSLVFRLISKNSPQKTTVWSVDDSKEWLDKTREFLNALNIDSNNLTLWDTFDSKSIEKFDLVLHDLGSMNTTRINILDDVLQLVKKGGLLVLDDSHKKSYREAALKKIEEKGYNHFRLTKYTTDEFNRYAILVRL
ncbi:MAG: methyltransferase domain-containing protein [Candidatus Hodarchaeales archaeon]|jgi:predicted O-methyltransferase YrrM